MYIIAKYKLTEDRGTYDRTWSIIEVIDTSESIDKFEQLIRSQSSFKALGFGDVSNLYRGHKKILMNLNQIGTSPLIQGLIRKHKLENILD